MSGHSKWATIKHKKGAADKLDGPFPQAKKGGEDLDAMGERIKARKAELMADTAWAKRYLNGGAPENREMTALLTLIAGDDTERSRNY